jgi:hypothetical protein
MNNLRFPPFPDTKTYRRGKRLTRAVIVAFLLVAVATPLHAQDVSATTSPPSSITGLNLTSVEKYSGAKLQGKFQQIGKGKWQEQAVNGDTRDYTEVKRDQNSVYLNSGRVYIQLDLVKKIGYYSGDNFQNVQPIYTLENPAAPATVATPNAVSGLNLTSVEKHAGDKVQGKFQQIGEGKWQEQAVNGDTRDYTEVKRDKNSVYLKSGPVGIQLDLVKKIGYYSADNFQNVQPLYSLQNPVGATAPTPPVHAATPSVPKTVTGTNLASVEKHSGGETTRLLSSDRGIEMARAGG